MNNKLGEAIKQRRKVKGLTLRELSSIAGLSPSHLGRIERGERFPSGRILRKLAEPLGFAETELLKLAGYMSRDDSDERVRRLKQEIKKEIARAFGALSAKIDSL